MTQDQGNRFVRQQVPESRPLIMLHHWGAPASVKVDSDGQGDHVAGKDFCVPPFHGEQARMNRWLPATLNSEHGGCMGRDGKPTARCDLSVHGSPLAPVRRTSPSRQALGQCAMMIESVAQPRQRLRS